MNFFYTLFYFLIMKDINGQQTEFLQNSYGLVYKKMPTHYLQMSPWTDGQDRRITEIDYDNCKVITFANACMIVNKQFDETHETWTSKGKQYKSGPVDPHQDIEEKVATLSMLPNHKVRIQAEEIMSSISDNGTVTISEPMCNLKLCRHKGKLYYILIVDETWVSGRAKAYDLFGKFCQWVGIKHVKPIFSITDKKFI